MADSAAWVPVAAGERDPQRFWVSVLGALRQTVPASELVHEVTAAPDLDGWAITERLLKDLVPLAERVWLVIDDLHELRSDDARRQLELLMMRGPPDLQFVLVARHDLRLGLHRLRLEGELTEIRGGDLRFTLSEARELFSAAGVGLPEPALVMLHERTEGWVAGLRLAALSLLGHPDPIQFAAEFSGSERTVAEYLLAEVLERQSEQVRRLLLRTSVLEQVSGELADAMTSARGSEGMLRELEEANAFVVALDAARSWFRYHHLFADLLRQELRRTAAAEVPELHRVAAGWYAEHGHPVEAIRHAQAARDWRLATELLADHWPSLHLDGQTATTHDLLAGFPAGARAADADLAALVAADELAQGSLEEAERYLELAERGSSSAGRGWQREVLLGIVRLLTARQRGNLPAAAKEAERLRAVADAPDGAQAGLSAELRALALISLGIAEVWAAQLEKAEWHLDQGVALARRAGRPYLEFSGLAYRAMVDIIQSSLVLAAARSRRAIELAEQHGWTEEPPADAAYVMLGGVLAWQGELEEADHWLQRAERAVTGEIEPGTAVVAHTSRGALELARGQDTDALVAFTAAERVAAHVATSHVIVPPTRALRLLTLIRLGETGRAERELAELGEQDRERGAVRVATAALRLAQNDPHAAAAALAPMLDGSAAVDWQPWLAGAFLLESIARDALGDPVATERAMERALDLAEPDGARFFFLTQPVPELLERHIRHRTAHAALGTEILSLLRGRQLPPTGSPRLPLEPLSDSEIRVLRYLPTNLSAPQIAKEMYLSTNTVKTHIHHLYAKLGTHYRAEAVARARDLGLLAPAAHRH